MNPTRRNEEIVAELIEEEQELDYAAGAFRHMPHPLLDKGTAGPRGKRAGSRKGLAAHPSSQASTVESSWTRRIAKAIRNTTRLLLDTQYDEGYWWAELESNVSITSEYIMLHYLLGLSDAEKERSMVNYLLNQQRADGSWGLYYGDDGNLSTTIEAYFALKLAGEDPQSPPLLKAKEYVLRHGGIEASRVFTKIWLALFGQYDWDRVPSMPVELVLLPPHFHFNIYEFSSWARATVVPLSIVLNIRPKFDLPSGKAHSELYLKDGRVAHTETVCLAIRISSSSSSIASPNGSKGIRSTRCATARSGPLKPGSWSIRKRAVTGEESSLPWSIAFWLCITWAIPRTIRRWSRDERYRGLLPRGQEGRRMQSCLSPVWDTALNALALLEAGLPPDHPALKRAASWLVSSKL